jgi:hypothetical protein
MIELAALGKLPAALIEFNLIDLFHNPEPPANVRPCKAFSDFVRWPT